MFCLGLPAALLATSPDCPAAPLAAPHGCSLPGAIVSLNASWAACFGITKRRAASLRESVEWCPAMDMTPACIGSSAFAACLVPDVDGAWIGHYRNDSKPDPAEGWGRCVAGEAAGFANWDEELGRPSGKSCGRLRSACAGIAGSGGSYDGPCLVPRATGVALAALAALVWCIGSKADKCPVHRRHRSSSASGQNPSRLRTRPAAATTGKARWPVVMLLAMSAGGSAAMWVCSNVGSPPH